MRIFHKRESLLMLPKGKLICMLKRKFFVASFRFLTIIILFVFVFFFLLHLRPSIESTCIWNLQKFPFFSFKIRVKSSFSHPGLGRSGCRLSNSTAIFLPDVSDIWKWPNPVKIPNVPFFYYKMHSGAKELIVMNHVNN